MLSRVAIQAARNSAAGQLASTTAPQFRAGMFPAKRCFANYSWGRVSSQKPWAKPLRDTAPKAERISQANVAFSLDKLPGNVAGFVALLGCMVFMTPQGIVTGVNMFQGVTGRKNEINEDGTAKNQIKRQATNVCKIPESGNAGNLANRKFNPRAMHPYMNGLSVGDSNELSRANSVSRM